MDFQQFDGVVVLCLLEIHIYNSIWRFIIYAHPLNRHIVNALFFFNFRLNWMANATIYLSFNYSKTSTGFRSHGSSVRRKPKRHIRERKKIIVTPKKWNFILMFFFVRYIWAKSKTKSHSIGPTFSNGAHCLGNSYMKLLFVWLKHKSLFSFQYLPEILFWFRWKTN